MRNRMGVFVRVASIVAFVLGSVALVSAPKPAFTKHEKAFFADSSIVAFVRPGLQLTILSANIASDGTITTRFRITDPKGLPLDKDGAYTPGAVSIDFLAAVLPKWQTQYTPYTAEVRTSEITGDPVVNGNPDEAGTFQKVGDGEYTYTFGTKAPSGFDASATHTIGAFASRDLADFDLGTNYTDATFNFVPNGSAVVNVRDVVKTASCNTCHDPLSFHDGTRRSVELCVLCHTAQAADPDTGLSLDFKVMVHKIHQGADLPSVKAGGTYAFMTEDGTVFDYSTLVFPADTRNCVKCHDPNSGAKQANNYLTKPNRAACGSCHDNVNFATGENHSADNLPEISDHQCANCHTPQGELEFDASITGAHTIPRLSQSLPGTVFALINVDNAGTGKPPAVTFSVKDKSGAPIPLSAMTRLALVLAGPTTDYASAISENAVSATANGDGSNTYTFKAVIPATATGTFSVGIEGYRSVKLLPGTKKEVTVRDAGANQVLSFSVDGSPVADRRKVVAIENCNQCHSSLSVHGDNRNQTVMCVLCHNPNATDAAQRPSDQNPPEAIDFRTMIHKIHTGENLNSEYTIYGFGGSKNDFTDVLFPGDRRNCEKCHVAGSEQLPLADNLLPVVSPRGYTNPTPPTTAACLACHTDRSAASHALGNTTSLGEACPVCHGPDAQFSIDKVHAR